MKPSGRAIGNIFGAFADGAVLFPLLAVLSVQNGFSATALLASAGVAYWISGWIFRIPMAVQPLKSIAIAAIAVGASSSEVRLSGAILGGGCLIIVLAKLDRFAANVPSSLVHGIQLSLGVILLQQGFKAAATDPITLLIAGVVALSIIGWSLLKRAEVWPALGVVALTGLLLGTFFSSSSERVSLVSAMPASLRWDIILSLVLPQIALTLTNSVLGTHDVAKRYFAEGATRVTVRRLLQTIGMGNLLSALVGGLPFCHGAGGLTAHYRGGARSWWSNAVIGSFLLLLAGVYSAGGRVVLGYPPALLGALLVATGFFHLRLAQPTWNRVIGSNRARFQLISMGATALLTRNMLAAFSVGLLLELCPVVLAIFQRPSPGNIWGRGQL